MIYPSADKIEANIESKYELVILAAKRCRQIREGSRPRVETDSENPLTIALEEIAAGVIKGREDKSSLAGQEAEADRQAVVGASLHVLPRPLVPTWKRCWSNLKKSSMMSSPKKKKKTSLSQPTKTKSKSALFDRSVYVPDGPAASGAFDCSNIRGTLKHDYGR